MGAITRMVSPGFSVALASGFTFTPSGPWCMTMLSRLSAWISPTVLPARLPEGETIMSVR